MPYGQTPDFNQRPMPTAPLLVLRFSRVSPCVSQRLGFPFFVKPTQENEMTTLNCCVLHSLQQRFPCRSSKTKSLAHAPPRHLMIGTTSSNLDAKQLGFPSDTIMLAIPQVNDQLVVFRHFVFVPFVDIFFPWACEFKYDGSLCFHRPHHAIRS